ncbi:class I SAM-dependent methyltransferase [Candidatus Woesearchaeota archaeon]|nr:class I SAM-dependent methyltransferase [Candidatus Woesearchaeota archaeon]
MDTIRFGRENRKYSALWQNGYGDANWRRLAKYVLAKVDTSERLSLIDFGFGRGAALDFFERHAFYVEGVEISSYAVENQRSKGRSVHYSSLDNLPMLKDGQFSIGFCNDVIEHVPEDLVAPSLEEMTRVCSRYLFISVCPTPSHHLSLNEENLHLTVKPVLWWEEQFKRYGEIERLRFLFSRSARYKINLNPKIIVKTPSET